MTTLSPSQQAAFDAVTEALPIGSLFTVYGRCGSGKTTVLRELHESQGGEFLTMKQYVEELSTRDPFQMEEALQSLLIKALQRSRMVIMDDMHLLYDVICGCGYPEGYPRPKFGEAIGEIVASFAVENGNKVIFATESRLPEAIRSRSYYGSIEKFAVSDYVSLCTSFLGSKASGLDIAKIHRFAPKLNAHQLKSACMWFRDAEVTTDIFIEYLRRQRMASNVELDEVEAVDLRSLKGFDDVIEALEANIIIPLEQDELATEFGIRPKRGVLLAGPPGTGKTTVGRALAHRLRSKFFLVDGTFISGSSDFYQKISRVFEAAKNNAPAIIFIDDSDVIFENKDDFGLYRYLLTMLDGLESESNKRICVMMTTMDVASVPPALVRSGRIELWLETRLPDRDARREILADRARDLPSELSSVDVDKLANDTEGLTGADLRRLMDDGKILYAYDKARKLPPQEVSTYFERAIQTIRTNKEKYMEAEEQARARSASSSGSGRNMPYWAYRMAMGEGDGDE